MLGSVLPVSVMLLLLAGETGDTLKLVGTAGIVESSANTTVEVEQYPLFPAPSTCLA